MRLPTAILSLALILISGNTNLAAQSGQLVDKLIEEQHAAFGKGVYLTLLAGGLITEEASIDESLTVLKAQGWPLEPKSPEDPINLGEYSFLLMKAFEIPGGLLYAIFPGPRDACSELAYLGFSEGNSSPYWTMSGAEMLRIMG